jgi:hypothetical protein
MYPIVQSPNRPGRLRPGVSRTAPDRLRAGLSREEPRVTPGARVLAAAELAQFGDQGVGAVRLGQFVVQARPAIVSVRQFD